MDKAALSTIEQSEGVEVIGSWIDGYRVCEEIAPGRLIAVGEFVLRIERQSIGVACRHVERVAPPLPRRPGTSGSRHRTRHIDDLQRRARVQDFIGRSDDQRPSTAAHDGDEGHYGGDGEEAEGIVTRDDERSHEGYGGETGIVPLLGITERVRADNRDGKEARPRREMAQNSSQEPLDIGGVGEVPVAPHEQLRLRGEVVVVVDSPALAIVEDEEGDGGLL